MICRQRALLLFAVLALMLLPWRPASAQASYSLAVGDVVELGFLHDNEEPRRFVIANDGQVQLPLVGGVAIAGLPLSDARDAIIRTYVERKLLVDPQISLAIADYRPVFVLGDVRAPGSFPYRPLLTVEQAVGLAGGPSTLLGNEEDRILMRSSLRSELEAVGANVAREAVWAGRLKAELDGRTEITEDDLPASARPFIDNAVMAELAPIENQILDVETKAFRKEVELAEAAIEAAKGEVELTNGLVTNQQESIAYYEADVERSKTLQNRGLTPQNEVSRREQSLTAAHSGLLQIYSELSRSRRNLNTLERELERSRSGRRSETLMALQERMVAISKLVSDHASLEERLALLTSWSEADADRAMTATIEFSIRRKVGDVSTTVGASAVTELLPGDAVTVRVTRPERGRNTPGLVDAADPALPVDTASAALAAAPPSGSEDQ